MNPKQMALFLLIMGLIFIGISISLFIRKEPTEKVAQHPLSEESEKTVRHTIEKEIDKSSNGATTQQSIAEEVEKEPETNQEKGWVFEDFVIQKIGKLATIKLLSQNSDYHKEGISAEENKEPDLKFSYQGLPFAVECKWRSGFYRGKLNWAKDYQVENYRQFQEEHQQRVFVALGVGGTPNSPNTWHFVPLYRLTQGYATEAYIEEFEVTDPKQLLRFIEKQVK